MSLEPTYRHTFDTAQLVAEHPPRWSDANKLVVAGICCPPGSVHGGQLVVSRWPAPPLPDRLDLEGQAAIEPRGDVFDYAPSKPPLVHWYVNFAHADLFAFYGGGLFAQDEMQVAEHPALGSLREAMLARDINPLTVEGSQPTPILIKGAERRCVVATDANPAEGRLQGLYGNEFTRAPAEAVARATKALDPPTISNILAVEAPQGSGPYKRSEIAFILRTALTGFTAAKIESGEGAFTAVHTGYWGCGAYGGDRVLMSLLQLIAAGASGINALIYHTVTADGMRPFIEAQRRFADEIAPLGPTCSSDVLLTALVGMGFVWGQGDGN